VVLQCLSGFRSAIAAGLLTSRGYRNVMNLRGGYQAWRRAGQPVLNGQKIFLDTHLETVG